MAVLEPVKFFFETLVESANNVANCAFGNQKYDIHAKGRDCK